LPPSCSLNKSPPTQQNGTNSSPYSWDHPTSPDYVRRLHNLVSASPYCFPAVLCSVHYQEDLRPHTNTTTCAPQCLKNLILCMSTSRKQVCKLVFFSASASVAEVPQRSSASWSSQHFPKSLCDPAINTHVDSADLILASLLFMRLCVVTLWFNQWSMNFNWLTDPHLPSMATQILLYFLEPSIMAL